jgi:hypothetical protein
MQIAMQDDRLAARLTTLALHSLVQYDAVMTGAQTLLQ